MVATFLFGSPRREGNTRRLMNHVLEELKRKEISVRVLHLNDLNIRPCQGCLSCLDDGNCKILDDMKDVRKYIYESDILVFASPVYWFSVSSQIKLVIDRMIAFMDKNYNSRIRGKKVMTILTSGAREKDVTEIPMLMLKKTFDLLGLDHIAHLEARGCDEDKDAVEKAVSNLSQVLELI